MRNFKFYLAELIRKREVLVPEYGTTPLKIRIGAKFPSGMEES